MSRPARWLAPLAADLLCVLALAAGGKDTHDADQSDWVVLVIAWPFALAAAASHAALRSRGRPATRVWPDGVVVVVVTYVLGMLVRGLAGRGLAPGFLVVAGLFLTATMLGWRLVALLVRRRSTSRARTTR